MERSAGGGRWIARRKHFSASVAMLALLSACGGGGGGGGTGGGGVVVVPSPTPTPTPPPTGNGCSLLERQNWAAAQLQEWYLFPELIAPNVNPADYTTLQSYVDALVAPARAQGKDRFFTVTESYADSTAFFSSGASGGFGVRFSYDQAGRVFVAEAFEGAPALAAGLDRGTEVLAVGTSEADLKPVSELLAAGGPTAFSDALGPATPGLTRVLRIKDAAGTRNVTVTKAEYNIPPVSSRYGAVVIDDGGKKVGYVNLRTFISTADPALRDAFAQFRALGITEVIVDFRYNAGGLIATAQLMSNLLLGQRTPAEVMQYRAHRASKASFDFTTFFAPQPQSVSSMKIAFIGTGASASASEVVMNSVLPYLGTNTALIGTNTFGKPVGQLFFDRPQCDDRIRPVTFFTQNASKQADYFTGIAPKFQRTCAATDDLTHQLGDPQEASIRTALDFLAGRQCTPIGASATVQGFPESAQGRELLVPAQPNASQRELPGSF